MNDNEIIVALGEIITNISNARLKERLEDFVEDFSSEYNLCPVCGGKIVDNFIGNPMGDCRGTDCLEVINEPVCEDCGYEICNP